MRSNASTMVKTYSRGYPRNLGSPSATRLPFVLTTSLASQTQPTPARITFSITHGDSLVPCAREKREALGTHYLRMRLISPRCGDSRLFSDSSVSCDVRVRTRYSKFVKIIKWCVKKVWIYSKGFLMPFSEFSMVLQTFNSRLALRTDEIRKAVVIVQRYI